MITNPSFTTEEIILCERLRALRMSGMADAFETQLQNPNTDLASFMERFSEIVNHEWQIRYDKKFNRFLKQAHLRYPNADLDQTIYDPARKLDTTSIERLATCHWIDEGKNLLVTGMTSSGKTYLSNALCISALRQLKTVRYIRANTLMLELEQARLKSSYLEYVTALTRLDLLAIDDFGLMELDLDKCRDLFEVIDGRDGRRSTILISQFPVRSWFDLFHDHTYADACLARITDKRHSYRIEMNGISMRETEK
ncbi:MAG: ATP-binding protein [Eubacteriales bacterium]|nr:ATP-binding protein [Eubacteriales bacterium]